MTCVGVLSESFEVPQFTSLFIKVNDRLQFYLTGHTPMYM